MSIAASSVASSAGQVRLCVRRRANDLDRRSPGQLGESDRGAHHLSPQLALHCHPHPQLLVQSCELVVVASPVRSLEAPLATRCDRETGIDQPVLQQVAHPLPRKRGMVSAELGERTHGGIGCVERFLACVVADLDRPPHVRIEVPRHIGVIEASTIDEDVIAACGGADLDHRAGIRAALEQRWRRQPLCR
jgi:hypothetical protein